MGKTESQLVWESGTLEFPGQGHFTLQSCSRTVNPGSPSEDCQGPHSAALSPEALRTPRIFRFPSMELGAIVLRPSRPLAVEPGIKPQLQSGFMGSQASGSTAGSPESCISRNIFHSSDPRNPESPGMVGLPWSGEP